jgi:hypothetical protein
MRHVEPVEQHVLCRREDHGVRADPERQRADGDRCESGTFGQHAHGVAQIAAKLVEAPGAPGLARVFPHRRQASQRHPDPAQGLLARHAGSRQIVGVALDVKLEIFAHLTIQILAAEHRPEPRCNPAA